MTVQELIAKSVRLIDDYPNITDYNTGYFDFVTAIVSELMRLEIGITPKKYKTSVPDALDYVPTDTDYAPVALPSDLTLDGQIVSISMDGTNEYLYTETHESSLYLLVPSGYTGDIIVKYMEAAPEYTSLTDTISISDDAVSSVAMYGLAEMFARSNSPEYTEMMAQKYMIAKATWRRRAYNPKRIRAVYNY